MFSCGVVETEPPPAGADGVDRSEGEGRAIRPRRHRSRRVPQSLHRRRHPSHGCGVVVITIVRCFRRLVELVRVGRKIALGPSCDLVSRGREEGQLMHEAPVREMLDEFGARVLHPRPRQHGRILAGRLERCSGQARQEILRAHIGQEVVGADRIASDARNDATVRPVHAARQSSISTARAACCTLSRSKASLPSLSIRWAACRTRRANHRHCRRRC